jgi:hypothetical protein
MHLVQNRKSLQMQCLASLGFENYCTGKYSCSKLQYDHQTCTAATSALDVSTKVHLGSALLELDGGQQEDFLTIASRYCELLIHHKEKTEHVRQLIDSMWLQELVLQGNAELLSILIGAIAEVDKGSEICAAADRALQSFDAICKLAMDSLNERAKAREIVSLSGGLDGLSESLTIQLLDVSQGAASLLAQLTKPAHTTEVRKRAKKRLRNVMA